MLLFIASFLFVGKDVRLCGIQSNARNVEDPATLKNEQQPTTTNNQQKQQRHTKRHVLLVAVELERY